MDILPSLDSLAENWARARVGAAPNEKNPAMHAATALCLAALQPGIAPTDRKQWMSSAAQLCPWIGSEVAHLAWALPESDIRLAFRQAWPNINPNQPQVNASNYVPSLPFGARTPPILTALAYGNIAAVSDALEWHGKPMPQMATSDTEKYRESVGQLIEPASWLAWSLSFRQWDLAAHLFALPSMRDQQSLDRALLEVAGTLAIRVAPNDNPLRHMDVPLACAWIKKLVEAGADLHLQHAARASHNQYQWFLGSTRGLDRQALEHDGWDIREGDPYAAYTHCANRKFTHGQEYLAPSPSQWLMSEHGPIGWRRKPRSGSANDDLADDRSIEVALANDIPALSGLWNGLTSRQWHDALSAVVAAHGTSAYQSNGWVQRPWCPDFLLDGFSRMDGADVFAPHPDPAKPHCLWLDAIALHVISKNSKSREMEVFYMRAVNAMAVCLQGNVDAFTQGLQRSLAFQGSTPSRRFSVGGTHGQVDDFLSIPGVQDLLTSLPAQFQEAFSIFVERDRDLHADWLAKADPGTDSMGSNQCDEARRADQVLSLHRGTLSAMGNMPGVARPVPRM